MKLKYLGTAAYEGVPALFCNCEACRAAKEAGGKSIRTRSQALVDGKLLIDFPADTYMHILRENIDLTEIHSCIITHAHSDHLYAEDLAARGHWFSHYEGEPLTVFATSAGYKKIMAMVHDCNMEEEKGLRPVRIRETGIPFETEGYRITPLPANHSVYHDPVIYIIERDGKRLLYAHDTGYFPDGTWEFLEREKPYFDCVSLDATQFYCDDSCHMGLSICAGVCERMEKLGLIDGRTRRILNHISHNGIYIFANKEANEGHPLTHEGMAEYAAQFGFELAYDGMEAEF